MLFQLNSSQKIKLNKSFWCLKNSLFRDDIKLILNFYVWKIRDLCDLGMLEKIWLSVYLVLNFYEWKKLSSDAKRKNLFFSLMLNWKNWFYPLMLKRKESVFSSDYFLMKISAFLSGLLFYCIICSPDNQHEKNYWAYSIFTIQTVSFHQN